MKTVFWLSGLLEFFDENHASLETLDVFWIVTIDCSENGIQLNKKLFV